MLDVYESLSCLGYWLLSNVSFVYMYPQRYGGIRTHDSPVEHNVGVYRQELLTEPNKLRMHPYQQIGASANFS